MATSFASFVAKRLFVAEKTVRNQLTALYEKLGVCDRLELLVHAYRMGLAPAPSVETIP